MSFRIGFGFDVHQLVEGRDFWLGGIKIPYKNITNIPKINCQILN